MTTLEDAVALLEHAQSAKRISGAKRLRKLAEPSAGSALLEALQRETNPRSWEPRYQLILALGVCEYLPALPFLRALAEQRHEDTILYQALGDAILRLDRHGSGLDAALRSICGTGNFMMMYGSFRAVALLQLVPGDAAIQLMIEKARDPRATDEVSGHPGDQTGIRLWLAVAAAGWKPALVRDFLLECQRIPKSTQLQTACADSLAGKYGKWSPY